MNEQAREQFQLEDSVKGAVIVGVRPGLVRVPSRGCVPATSSRWSTSRKSRRRSRWSTPAKDAANHDRKALLLLVRRGERQALRDAEPELNC